MRRRAGKWLSALLAGMLAVHSVWVPAARGGDILQTVFHTRRLPPGADPAIETLAEQIDWLENHIDRYGSVVAKQPDIWGQARLTKHRQEYEDLLRQKLDDFELLLNGQLTRSDQSYLASALALSAAVSGGRRASVRRAPAEEDAILPQPVDMSVVNTLLPSITPGVVDYQTDAKGNVTPKVDATKVTNQTNIFRTPPGSRVPGFGAQFANNAQIGLEPTIVLDQLSRYLSHLDELRRINEGDDTADSPGYSLNLVRIPISISPGQVTRKGYGAEITVSCTPRLSATLLPTTFRSLVINDVVDQLALPVTQLADNEQWRKSTKMRSGNRLMYGSASVEAQLDFRKKLSAIQGPSARSRQAHNPVPPSQVIEVFGQHELTTVAEWFFTGYRGPNVRWSDDLPKKRVHFPDVQRFIEAEAAAAFEMLARPDTESLWQHYIEDAQLVESLRTGDMNRIAQIRNAFANNLASLRVDGISCGCVDALAWAIIVEAALLNDQLITDMQEVAEAKGCGCAPSENLQYYLPHPSPEACQSFNEYVLCRWPIHVFALDPVTQDQNIGDTYSRAQELQLALSLSFVSGRMNANSLTRYARRLETEMQTVALNRTAVGFSHGDDTFGWRFYPRFQSPPFKGTIANFGETLLGPSRDGDLMERQIEPGMRECVAIVIMPSFVPYVTFDSRTNWFRLNHCNGWLPTRHHVENSMVHALKLSRSIRGMERSALMASCPELYRDGELDRLMRRVRQLDKELPLQTMLSQVPIENTLGGFEMFSHGVTDLAPELYGWYGGPGIVQQDFDGFADCKSAPAAGEGKGQGSSGQQNNSDAAANHRLSYEIPKTCPCTNGTTLFLVGDHFSVHDTKVIAGHRCIPDVTLLSRQVMRVTIPGDVETVVVGGDPDTLDDKKKKGEEYVDVHLATPYGVTAHLHIPTIRKPPKPPAKKPDKPAVTKPAEKKPCEDLPPPCDECLAPPLMEAMPDEVPAEGSENTSAPEEPCEEGQSEPAAETGSVEESSGPSMSGPAEYPPQNAPSERAKPFEILPDPPAARVPTNRRNPRAVRLEYTPAEQAVRFRSRNAIEAAPIPVVTERRNAGAVLGDFSQPSEVRRASALEPRNRRKPPPQPVGDRPTPPYNRASYR